MGGGELIGDECSILLAPTFLHGAKLHPGESLLPDFGWRPLVDTGIAPQAIGQAETVESVGGLDQFGKVEVHVAGGGEITEVDVCAGVHVGGAFPDFAVGKSRAVREYAGDAGFAD